MTEALVALAQAAEGLLPGAILVFLRVGAVMALLPGFGETLLPARVRLGLALAFSAIVYPAVAGGFVPALPVAALTPEWFLAEISSGLALGAILRLGLFALTMAGAMMAQASSLSQMFGGVAGEPAAALVTLMQLGGVALAVILGLPERVAAALILSYEAIPAGSFIPSALVYDWGTGHAARALGVALALSAPVMLAALLYNVALGAMNRAMPHLMMSMIGAPALAGGSLVILALLLPAILALWWQGFAALLDDPFAVPR